MRAWVALAVFALAYALIAARRFRFLPIGRPTGALLGAVLMVLLGCLTPKEAYASIDGRSLSDETRQRSTPSSRNTIWMLSTCSWCTQ